jgi:hypothetical protein
LAPAEYVKSFKIELSDSNSMATLKRNISRRDASVVEVWILKREID